jgi:hypothetical protein
MELSKEFNNLVSSIFNQKLDEFFLEQSQRRHNILEDSASRGFSIPQGSDYGKFDGLQVDSIKGRSNIIWCAIKQTLEAFNPSYYPELETQLYSLAEKFFPLSICEPHDYLRGMGWKRPMEDQVNQQLRSQLDAARRSSLNSIKTNIGLYVAKIKNVNTSTQPTSMNIESLTISHSPNIQIGNGNIQEINMSVQTLIDAIDKSNGKPEEKAEAKSILKTALTSPVVAALIGAVSKGIFN